MTIETDIDRVARQERDLIFPSFGADVAWSLGLRLRDMARDRQHAIVIDVSLFSMPLFYAAFDGTSPDNANWVRRKRNCVARFLTSSYATGLALGRDGRTLQDKFGLSDADFAAHGGSFPISVTGAGCIGAVTVSGLPQRQDHALVVEALALHLGKDHDVLQLDA